MKCKPCFKVKSHSSCQASALLLVRVVMGVAFLMHGFGKIQAPFNWMGPESPVPGFLQFLAALSEFGGGISLILGLLVPLFSLGLAFTMAVAVYMHAIVKGDGFVGGYELAAVYLSLSLLFMAVGPGQYSADHKIFGEKS